MKSGKCPKCSTGPHTRKLWCFICAKCRTVIGGIGAGATAELEKAFYDTVIRGTGFVRMGLEGVKHVPYSNLVISDESETKESSK